MLKDRVLFQQVQQLLEQETHQVSKLLDLLKAETLALQNPDSAALAEVIKHKALPLAALEQSQRARYKLLSELQCPADENGWNDLVTQLDINAAEPSPALSAVFDNLLQTLTLCRTANHVNEEIVSRSQYSVQHLLDIMRGDIPNNKLYSATGNTVTINDARPITAA